MAPSLTGVDNEVSGIKDIYSTAQHNFSVKSAKHGEDVSFLSDLAATLKNWWGNGSLPKQYKNVNFYVANGFEAAAEFSPSNAGTFNMGKKVHGFFSKLTSFCDFADRLKKLDRKVLAFNEDLRWALDFLRDFYRRLNLYIDKDFTADYRITVNGENTRNFRFMDTDNNVQYWKVAINMRRKERTGGDRYSPAGTYEGDAAADTPAAPGTTKNTGKSPVKEIFGEAAPELPKLPERSGAGYSKADYSFAYDPSRYDNGPVDEEIVKAGEALAMFGLVNSDENATYEPEYDSYTSVPEYENIDVSDIDKYFAFFKENDSNYYVGTGAEDNAIGTGCLYGDESNSGGVSSGGTFNGNYADIYKQSIDLTDKFYMIYSTEKDSHNEAIEKKADEEDRFFWNDPKYISFINVPFNIWDSMYFAQFNDKTDLSVIKSGLEFVAEINGDENLVLNRSDDGEYTLTFDGTYYDDDYNEYPSKVTITADVDAASGGIRVHEIEYVETLGESFFDMYEFMPLGGGKYALQSGTERLLLETDSSGSISDFAYSVIKEGNAGYSVEDSMFGGNTVPDKEWVMEKSSSCVLTAVRTGDKTEFGKPAKK